MPESTQAGDVLAGRYRFDDLLAEARGGAFWHAHDNVLHRPVAVHIISHDDERAEGLLDAARRVGPLNDRRILRVLDADTEDRLCYVVNEWGAGESLDIILNREGPLPPRRAAWLVAEVADSLARAHAQGLTHGRLVPENVLVDVHGQVRLIGFGVDAALLGLPTAGIPEEVLDLAGLLYCALTGKWAGSSPSQMPDAPGAPGAQGGVLRPRQVRAGIPRPLDELCDRVLNDAPAGRGSRSQHDLTTAAGVCNLLRDFVGDLGASAPAAAPTAALAATVLEVPATAPDPTVAATPDATDGPGPAEGDAGPEEAVAGQAESEAAGPAREPEPIGEEPADEEGVRHEAAPEAVDQEPDDQEPDDGEPDDQEPDGGDAHTDEHVAAAAGGSAVAAGPPSSTAPTPTARVDLPTQAGMPVFHDDTDDVEWVRARSGPVVPPPPLEDPPHKPLFAPDPPEGQPLRRPRPGASKPKSDSYWPWQSDTGQGNTGQGNTGPSDTGTGRADTGTGSWGTGSGSWSLDRWGPPEEWGSDGWGSDGWATDDTGDRVPGRSWIRLAMLLAVGSVILIGVLAAYQLRLGGLGPDPGDASPTTRPPVETAEPQPFEDVTAQDFDPQGAPPREENPELVPLVLDGDPSTSWRTATYRQNFGPGGLKDGVGLMVDLGTTKGVRQISVSVTGQTSVAAFLTQEAPTGVADLTPAGEGSGNGTIIMGLDEPVSARFVTIWLTSLPVQDDGQFRGTVSEVQVLG